MNVEKHSSHSLEQGPNPKSSRYTDVFGCEFELSDQVRGFGYEIGDRVKLFDNVVLFDREMDALGDSKEVRVLGFVGGGYGARVAVETDNGEVLQIRARDLNEYFKLKPEEMEKLGPETRVTHSERLVEENVKGDREEWVKVRKGESRRRIHGEYKKNSDEMQMISEVNDYILEELERLGISTERRALSPEQFHLLSNSLFARHSANRSDFGQIDNNTGSVLINKEKIMHTDSTSLTLLMVKLHEALHAYSYERYHFRSDNELDHTDGGRTRVGYLNFNMLEEGHEHFRGLNEAVTEMMALELLYSKRERINNKFRFIDDYNWEHFEENYQGEMRILELIKSRLKDAGNGDVWDRIKKGYFSGEMMHLRDIERVFGKGSLRVLAALDSGTVGITTEEHKRRVDDLIFEYFSTDDEKRKSQIAGKVLNERERIRYKNRANS